MPRNRIKKQIPTADRDRLLILESMLHYYDFIDEEMKTAKMLRKKALATKSANLICIIRKYEDRIQYRSPAEHQAVRELLEIGSYKKL